MFKVNNKDTRTMPMAYFTPCSGTVTVKFELENAAWESIPVACF